MGYKFINGGIRVNGSMTDNSGSNPYVLYNEMDDYVSINCLPFRNLTLVKASEYDEDGASGTEIIFMLNGFAITMILDAAREIFGTKVTMEQIVAAFNSPDTPEATKAELYKGLLRLWLTSLTAVRIGIYDGTKISERWSPILSVTFDGYFTYMHRIDGVDTISTGNIATYDRISYGQNE